MDHKLYVMKKVAYSAAGGHADAALREVKMLKMLKHPNIVEFVEA